MSVAMPEVETSLVAIRRKRGISATHLAEAAGVSRQTIYAIEAGTYVPNTMVALRLARSLECTVEELFALPGEPPAAKARTEIATLLPGSTSVVAGQPVRLCRVGKRLVATSPSSLSWFFPEADAIAVGTSAQIEKTRVQVVQEEEDFGKRLLVAGCDPGISVLARHGQAAGVELVLAHRNSSQALALLKAGSIHIAGTHLRDETSGESNLPEIQRLFPKKNVAVISFATWEEGILTPNGNPKGVRGVEDLARKDIRIVNRELGAGSRALLDSHLQRLGISPKSIHGYDAIAPGHLPAAWQVQSGTADACISTRAAARLFGLHFLPLITERYDLVIRKEHMELPKMQNLLDVLARRNLRRELESLGGYDTGLTGQRML